MPLEISEIGIHVRVPDAAPAPAAPAAQATDGAVEHARVVDDCVRRVLRILDMRAER